MAQTATSLASVIKDAWTSTRLQKQFEAENAPLSRIESFAATMVGTQAQVPVYNNRSGAYTSVGAAGGNLNPAQAQQVTQATYTLVYNWFQIALDTSALATTGSNVQAVVSAKDLEVEGAVENTRHQMTRQIVTNGDGKIAACGTSASSTTVPLTAQASEGTNWGYSALKRGWLFPNMTVDIGTTSDTDALVTATTISAIDTTPTAPTITVGTAVAPTAGTHFVYVPNPNSATAANPELNGIRQIANSSGALGGLNPSTAGQEFWQAAGRDTSTSVLSLDLLADGARAIKQNGGGSDGIELWYGFKQEMNFNMLLQNQVRFASPSGTGVSTVGATWNGITPRAYADILDTDIFMLRLKDFVKITGSWDSPKWASDLQGSNTGALWSQGTTQFVDAVVWPLQIGVQRRNAVWAATALTA